MASSITTSTINGLLPRLIEKGRLRPVVQSRFFQRMNQVRKINKINPAGLFSNFQTSDNNTAFAVAEGGPILGGSAPEFAQGLVQLRQHWSSMAWTGALERIRNEFLAEISADQRFTGNPMPKNLAIAGNLAVAAAVESALASYARRENFFALQGTNTSAIGVITGSPTANPVQFSWATTNQGNRLFAAGQQVQIFSPGGVQRTGGLASTGSSQYNTVLSVDKSAASGATGPVTFAEAPPSNAAIGDTVVFRNSYGLMPTGFIHYVDDAGTYKGITRSSNPDLFSSVIQRLSGSPTLTPAHIRTQLSLMESKLGYETPNDIEVWWNKTNEFNWEAQIYATPFVRNLDATQPNRVDLAPGVSYWNGRRFQKDQDVPPSHVNFINFATWRKVTQTPLQAYAFDGGSYVINPINSYGERLDQRQSTIFSEYNWDCEDPRSNGRIEGTAFDNVHV
jgi:hypothetical protein